MKKKQYERPFIQRLNAGLMGKFGTTSQPRVVSDIDGIPVADMIQQYGSPLYVLSENTIRKNCRDAYRAFSTRYPKVQLAWSYKTNYIAAVCNVFHSEGLWAEVVSGFEYDKAIRNKVPGNKIIFNGPDKKTSDLEKAVANNSSIHIDHFDELILLTEVARRLKVRPRAAIRVNMDTGIYPTWDRFGFNYESGEAWNAIVKIMKDDAIDLTGLHCHIGTFIISHAPYAAAAIKLMELFLRVSKVYGKRLEYIDLGGGFASRNTIKGSYLPGEDVYPGFDKYAEAITGAFMASGIPSKDLPVLILESGRAMIDDAGYLLGTVVSHKRLADGRRATIVDFGVNILITAFWYDHKISPAADYGNYTEDTIIYGPLCMNIDVVRENISLPPLKKGDVLVVHNAGAYNMTQWMQFITQRPAVIIAGSSGETHLIRKAESAASVEGDEIVPENLKHFNL
jgi:diaminopimelate decarboxylase